MSSVAWVRHDRGYEDVRYEGGGRKRKRGGFLDELFDF